MLSLLAELNKLPIVDIVFFIVLGVIIVICVAIYFLIPVINKKQYQEMRDNLNKREIAFKANLKGEAAPEEPVEVPEENETPSEN